MKKIVAIMLLLACVAQLNAQDAKMNSFVSNLMSKMTLDEKIGQLNLVTPGGAVTGSVVSKDVDDKIRKGAVGGLFGIWGPEKVRQAQKIAVDNSRLHIPLIFGLDVIHGHKTIFPIPLGMAATWDTSLIEKSARIAATEASADGLKWAFSPMVDIARDPRWGRISEGNGEDPYLGSKIAKAMVRGYQGNDLRKENAIMACVKHFALYGGAEAGREYNTVDMSRLQMYQDYLPPYKAAVDAGVGSVMSSFNVIDGVPATGNKWLLTDLLRKQWGFTGLVVSDYTSVSEMTAHGMGDLQAVSALALKAGLDMDMVAEGFLNTLKKSLKEGKITQQNIDVACRRVLEAKYKMGLFKDPYRNINEERASKEILTDEKVYEFLDKVFTEVAQLFPFEYIHIGGDEAAKNFWEKSEDVKKLMQKEGLKNVEEVQSYFVKRVEKIIQSKGKKLIGWDEILQGGLAPSATVMSWRGMKGGIEAAKMGHQVVMAPLDYTYVELMQGDPYVEPPEFGLLRLSQSYKFEPVPAGVNRKLILGGEACLWSEHNTNMRAAQYLLWPRALAVAECVWSPKENKNYENFISRVENQFERMDIARIKYSRSMYDPAFNVSRDANGQLIVELQTEVPGLAIYYSFDETNPDEFYPKYEKSLTVPHIE